MKNLSRVIATVVLAGWIAPAWAVEAIPAHQAKKIEQAAPAQPRVPPARPRRVLVFSTPAHLYGKDPHKGYCVPYGAAAMQALGQKSGAFEPVLSDELSSFLPESLKRFDAVVLNNACGPWITPTEQDMAQEGFRALGRDQASVEQALRQGLLDYVQGGGGIVAIHFAIAANAHWPAFAELIGGRFTGHPWNEEVGVCVEEPAHPLSAAYGGNDFRLADEIYQYGGCYDRSKVRVLMSLDPERTNMGVKWISQSENDFPLVWVRSAGKGRVFYTSFGHRTELFWDQRLLGLYLDAIQFACGDLRAETAPRADRPAKRVPGPTAPADRLARMKARGVSAPSDEQIRLIESAAPDRPPARPARPRKVLVWGHSWTHPPNPFAEKAIEILGRKTGAFQAVISDDPRLLLGDRLPQFDALVMNNIHEGEPFLPEGFAKLPAEQQTAARQMDQAIRKSILEYVAGAKDPSGKVVPGRGIVGTHAATAALGGWREYLDMMGGSFGGYILQDLVICADEPAHPLAAGLEGRPLRIRDEIYIFPEPQMRKTLRILLRLDMEQTRFPDKVELARPGLEKGRPDRDHAVSWVRQYGTGRVFYTVLGHEPATHWNGAFLRHLLAGIQFAVGDLEAEAAPSAR